MSRPAGDRLLWTGRLSGVEDGWDGWSADRDTLTARLDQRPELVLLDPLSFPWPLYTDERAVAPLTVVLPRDLDAPTLVRLLDEPLRGRLTAYDRLVDARPDVRSVLGAAWHLPVGVWADGWERDAADVAAAGAPKEVLLQAVDRLTGAVRSGLPGSDAAGRASRVALGGAAEAHRGPLAGRLGVEVEVVGLDEAGTGSCDAVVVVVDHPDGPARVALLAAAHAASRPGGTLVVLADVVTVPGGPPRPPLSRLVEDVQSATGGAVHTEDLASVRWGEEPWARGVVLRLTSWGSVAAPGGRS